MARQIQGKDWLFLLACLGLGALAEVSFLHGSIGMSYLIFIAGFYLVFFSKFKLSFNHRRIGLLFMVSIWMLSGSFLLYSNELFYHLNQLVIPILVLSHIVLITRPNTFQWDTPKFIIQLASKLRESITYGVDFLKQIFRKIFKNLNQQTSQMLKRILTGVAVGAPLVLIITGLLMSADAVFQSVVLRLPLFILDVQVLVLIFRLIFSMIAGVLFFSIFKVLRQPDHKKVKVNNLRKTKNWDSITAITILVLLNMVYLLFVIIQFKYFFGSGLIEGFTYAEYARKGFAELLLVMLINWTVLMSFLKLVHVDGKGTKRTINILYSLLIVVSGIMLASAYQRLTMYEAAYGFTLERLLAHAFMIFLMIIFAYTLIRVWIEQLSVTHFYLIMGLIFYTIVNVVNIEQIIVDQNMKRYEQTGKVDIHYLSSLSYTGWNGLLQLYELDEEYPELKEILAHKQEWLSNEPDRSWQSFNFSRQKVMKQFNKFIIKGDDQ